MHVDLKIRTITAYCRRRSIKYFSLFLFCFFCYFFPKCIFFTTSKLQALKLLFTARQQISASNQTQNTRSKFDWNWEMTTFTFTAFMIFKPFILFLRDSLTRKFWNTKPVTFGKNDSYIEFHFLSGEQLLFHLVVILPFWNLKSPSW